MYRKEAGARGRIPSEDSEGKNGPVKDVRRDPRCIAAAAPRRIRSAVSGSARLSERTRLPDRA